MILNKGHSGENPLRNDPPEEPRLPTSSTPEETPPRPSRVSFHPNRFSFSTLFPKMPRSSWTDKSRVRCPWSGPERWSRYRSQESGGSRSWTGYTRAEGI